MEKTATVLMVEDDPGDALLMQTMLAEGGEPVNHDCVANLAAAIQRLSRGDVAAVLLDLFLPDSKGLDTLVKLRLAVPDIPIVILSGLDDREVSLEAIRLGAQDYLVKGKADGDTVRRTLRYAVERARIQSQLARERQASQNPVWVVDASPSTVPANNGLVRVLSAAAANRFDGMAAHLQNLRTVGRKVVLVSLESPYEALREGLLEHGFDSDGIMCIDAVGGGTQARKVRPGVLLVESPAYLEKIGMRIETLCGRIGTQAHVVVDSLNVIAFYNHIAPTQEFAHYLSNRMRALGVPLDMLIFEGPDAALLTETVGGFVDARERLV